jgi:hypothetical protein
VPSFREAQRTYGTSISTPGLGNGEGHTTTGTTPSAHPHSPSTGHENSSRSSKLKSIATTSPQDACAKGRRQGDRVLDNEHPQCPLSRARLRHLVCTISPPLLPKPQFVQYTSPSALPFPAQQQPSLPPSHHFPPAKSSFTILDSAQNNTLITAGLHPTMATYTRLACRPFAHAFANRSQFIASALASVTSTARVLATYTSVPNLRFTTLTAVSISQLVVGFAASTRSPPCPFPSSLPISPIPNSLLPQFPSSPPSSHLPSSPPSLPPSPPPSTPSPVPITTSSPLPLAAPSPHPPEAVSAAQGRLNIKTSTTDTPLETGPKRPQTQRRHRCLRRCRRLKTYQHSLHHLAQRPQALSRSLVRELAGIYSHLLPAP